MSFTRAQVLRANQVQAKVIGELRQEVASLKAALSQAEAKNLERDRATARAAELEGLRDAVMAEWAKPAYQRDMRRLRDMATALQPAPPAPGATEPERVASDSDGWQINLF